MLQKAELSPQADSENEAPQRLSIQTIRAPRHSRTLRRLSAPMPRQLLSLRGFSTIHLFNVWLPGWVWDRWDADSRVSAFPSAPSQMR